MAGGWESLGLLPELVRAVEDDFDWRLPSGIQDECIPLILGGGDVMGSAETGSGKTAAFALPLLQLCVEYKERQLQHKRDNKNKKPKREGEETTKSTKNKNNQSNLFVMSTQDRDPTVGIHPDSKGLRIQSKNDKKVWAGCRCSAGVSLGGNSSGGKYSFECTILDSDGTVRIGWSTVDASLQLGTDREGYGYGGSGVKVHQSNYDPIDNGKRLPFGKGDVVGCHIEVLPSSNKSTENNNNNKQNNNNNRRGGGGGGGRVVGTISFSKNGTFIGKAYDIKSQQDELCLFPTVCFKNAECQLDFGGATTKFQHPPPSGYVPLANLATTKQANNKQNNHLAINPLDALSSSHSNNNPKGGQQQTENNGEPRGPMVIVIEPTRDLAQQTYRCFDDLSQKMYEYHNDDVDDEDLEEDNGNEKKSTPSSSSSSRDCYRITAALLVGGLSPQETLRLCRENKCDVLVGTPPIIASYMKKKGRDAIAPDRCRFFVLDEADELISTDSIIPIKAVYGRILAQNSGADKERYDRLQVCFFSATLHSKEVRDLASTLCHRPLWVDLRGKNDSILPDTVHHIMIHVDPSTFDEAAASTILQTDAVHRKGKLGNEQTIRESLRELKKQKESDSYDSECIKQLKPKIVLEMIEQFNMDQVLIFCRTNLDCDLMEQFFKDCMNGKIPVPGKQQQATGGGGGRDIGLSDKYACRVLAGRRSMQERQQSLQDFKDGEVRILICTDVAARGLDIRELPFVIQTTLPDDAPETYVHRIGRVGRAERIGLALSIVASKHRERVWYCQSGKKPPCADTRDYARGGNCVWYNEPKFWKDIEHLIKTNKKDVTELVYPNRMELPGEIEKLVTTGGYGNYAGGSSIDEQVQLKMKQMETVVKQISKTEQLLQTDYWNMTNYYANNKRRS